MKKIMFSDKYGLTQAVLNGSKTMTRRIISNEDAIYSLNEQEYMNQLCIGKRFCEKYSRYQIGEVVAIAQNYKDAGLTLNDSIGFIYYGDNMYSPLLAGETSGWTNKMFVQSDLMPNQIRITNIKVERLQDISDEDCLKEGIFKWCDPFHEDRVEDFGFFGATKHYMTAKDAFAALIDKVSGKGTWDSNPWVFAYEFKLVK